MLQSSSSLGPLLLLLLFLQSNGNLNKNLRSSTKKRLTQCWQFHLFSFQLKAWKHLGILSFGLTYFVLCSFAQHLKNQMCLFKWYSQICSWQALSSYKSGTVVSTLASQQQGLGFDLEAEKRFSVWSLFSFANKINAMNWSLKALYLI